MNLYGSFKKLLLYIELRPQKKEKDSTIESRREIPKLHTQSRPPKRLGDSKTPYPESTSKDSDERFQNSKPEPISKKTQTEIPKLQTRVDLQRLRQRFRNSKPESISKDSDGRFQNSIARVDLQRLRREIPKL